MSRPTKRGFNKNNDTSPSPDHSLAEQRVSEHEPEEEGEECLDPNKSVAGDVTRRRTGPKATFPWTDTQEEDLVSWWRKHTILYNNQGAGFFDKKRKEKLFAEKAKEIGDGCTALDVRTHLRSLRTKLNHILKHGPTGEWREPRTPRERWVWDRLDFIRPFISRRDSKQSTKSSKASSAEGSPSRMFQNAIAVGILPEGSDSEEEGGSVSSYLDGLTSSPSKLLPRSWRRREDAAEDVPAKRTRVTTHGDEEEVDSFLAHLGCTLLRMPADERMEMQARILVMVYSRLREHTQPNSHSRKSENGQTTGNT